jgi:hypothetical protein
MAIDSCCSFDHFGIDEIDDEWTFVGTGPTVQSGGGRNGTNSARFANFNRGIYKTPPTTATTKAQGCSFKFSAYPTGDTAILQLNEGSTNHVDARMTSSGTLKITRNGTQLGSTSSYVVPLNQEIYIELKAFVNDSTGTAELRVNGTAVVGPLTSQDTRNGGTPIIDRCIVLGGSVNLSATVDVDDWYEADDFLGDMRVAYLVPTAEGTTIQLTPSSGTDNSALVDETDPDGDTTYVEHATDGNKDTYVMANLPSTATTVHGVLLLAYARKDDAGAKSIALVARESGGTEADSADKALNTSYDYYEDMRTTKPGGGSWSTSDVDGMEVGVKVRP